MARKYFFSVLSVPVFGIMYLYTTLMIVAGLPFLFLKSGAVVKGMMQFWAKGIFLLMGKKIHVEGKENLERNRRFILVANHSSLFDIIAIISLFPDLVWFGHERLMKIPVFRRVLILTGYVPMRKATYRNTKEMMEQLKERAKNNNIAIFPEGTRTLNGKMNDFYRGFVILLRSSEVNVLPVTLNGFYRLKPKNRNYIDFSANLRVKVHKLIHARELVDRSDREIISAVKSIIESSLTEANGYRNNNGIVVRSKAVINE